MDSVTEARHDSSRSAVTVELRNWDITTCPPSTVPRVRHLRGDTSWERLHHVAFTTFGVDRATHTVHFHRDPFRDTTAQSKPRLRRALWAAGVYHGVALRVRGERTFAVYAHFVRSDLC